MTMTTTTTRDPLSIAGLRVLVVDDEADIRAGLKKLIATLGATVETAADGLEALEVLDRLHPDLVLTDLMMPRMTGAELLPAVKERSPATEVVVLTGFGTIQTAVACLQNGAAHFMTKPFDNQEVVSLVTRLGRQLLAGRRRAATGADAPRIVAEDPAMQRVLQLVERVAASPVPVLIEGESGTGKEVVAAAIHRGGIAPGRPFLAVNAAALSDALLESELFGHRKGAFTGADRDHRGLFEQAQGGTVFLDELCSMSPSFQGKLLRVLEDKVVRPVGADRDMPVEFRLVSATNRELGAQIARGEFREDLFYRIGVMRIHLPPLRERLLDIVPLALRFLHEAAETCLGPGAKTPELSQSALDSLLAHPWPGNVRELQNAMFRALIVCPGDRVQAHHLGLGQASWTRERAVQETDYAEGKRRAVEGFQREFVQRALEGTEGNVSRAAQRCGMTRAALQRILRQLEIDPAGFR
jgi:DNA-binding NtrC family response regulator